MNRCGIAVLQASLLLVGVSANAVEKSPLIRITVVDSETHSVGLADNGVPVNCDQVNFDAYCHNSRSAQVTNYLLVQEGSQPPFRVSCAVESKWSRCIPLPKGQSFDARRDKRGLSVYYADDKGKLRQQLYTYVAGQPMAAPVATTTGTTAVASSASSAGGASPTGAAAGATNPTPAAASASGAQITSATQGTVKCSFSSTPPGAEVTVDGRYVGSTPSVLTLSTGNHTVEVSLPGFARWKRDLTVSAGSELSVNAVLEKAQ